MKRKRKKLLARFRNKEEKQLNNLRVFMNLISRELKKKNNNE